jgi:hypothetical protein
MLFWDKLVGDAYGRGSDSVGDVTMRKGEDGEEGVKKGEAVRDGGCQSMERDSLEP